MCAYRFRWSNKGKTIIMTDFQRTRSKVWFLSLDDDDDDIQQHRSWRRQPSSSPESRRVSSGSPSNGSHKSQDSGFSDSESSGSSLQGPSSKNSPKGDEDDDDCNNGTAADSFVDNKTPRMDGVITSETTSTAAHRIIASCIETEECDCFLPACELSRKFRSYECTASVEATPTKWYAKNEPRTPNRTCFIVDELPKNGGSGGVTTQQSTPSSVKSFDGHFDQSENVTVVENVKQDDDGNEDGIDDLIIEPPTPFVDRFNDMPEDGATAVSLCESNAPNTPEHTSTPKPTKDRCCTPRLHYKKDLQLRKPKKLQYSFDR